MRQREGHQRYLPCQIGSSVVSQVGYGHQYEIIIYQPAKIEGYLADVQVLTTCSETLS